jgi:hypothetical protein
MISNQIYIDPVYVKGNILRVFIRWDWKTKIDLQVTFLNIKVIPLDRFGQIGFIMELMRRNDIDFIMDKNTFINMNFKEMKGLDIKILKVEF